MATNTNTNINPHKQTMKAVVFKGPHKVVVEDRPIPTIKDDTDIIVAVEFTALCGSELHVFRGHQPSGTGFIMGHEFTGRVSSVGSAVRGFALGDRVVAPFTVSCGECFYCARGFSSRCARCLLFGCPQLDGGQAEYVRVPLADSTAFKAPEGVRESALVLMADIFPTGYFAASNGLERLSRDEAAEATVVLLGLGPVGSCALLNILDYKPKNLIVVDGVEDRLKLAERLGGGKVEAWNFLKDEQGLKARVKELTDGRGADVVIEVVGQSAALRLGFDLLRPWGILSSVGVHVSIGDVCLWYTWI